MKLSDTKDMMCSADYKERFAAEYYQLLMRIKGLRNMLFKWDNGELDFIPSCSRETFVKQLNAMEAYLEILKYRAIIEKIRLEEI